MSNDFPINDTEMKKEMISDLEEHYGYSKAEAIEWIKEHGHKVVDSMWDAYSHYFEQNAEFKKEEV